MKAVIRSDIIATTRNAALFKPWFKDPRTWAAWFAFLKALFGLEMTAEDLAVFRACTGRDSPPSDAVTEAWLVCGRRAGKSLTLALVTVYLAMSRDWTAYLQPGERGTVMIIAADRRQARTIFRYIASMLKDVEVLARMVERETADTLELTNQVSIEIQTASFRTTRGYTLIACLADEIAFWTSDESGANPDVEILAAIKPAMSTIPGAMLLCASSPYARKGALWNAYSKHYGQPGIIRRALGSKPSPVLVWNADTRTMNPTVPQELIDEAFEDDPARAIAEYGRDGNVEFRSDVESFISREVLDACTIPGRHELPPVQGIKYVAFVDPAGGSGTDAMTLAIAHRGDDGKAVLDLVREVRPPFSPEAVTAEFSAILQAYGITKVVGDRYAGEWPRERFGVHGKSYEISDRVKSDIYQAALPILNSGGAELFELPRMYSQFLGLERRTARGGRDSIDHAPGGHDDIANAVAGALALAYAGSGRRGALAVGVEGFGSRGAGGMVADGKYTVAKRPHISVSSPGYAEPERPPPPPADLRYVEDDNGEWVLPWIDPRSR
jgi:hypothetical protein